MQVFMPYKSIIESVRCLDYRRLGKQRIEIKYMLEMLYGMWAYRKHPVVEMWEDYYVFLEIIYSASVREWISRGHTNTLPIELEFVTGPVVLPPWLEDYTYQYKGLLLYKDYDYYSKKFDNPEDIPRIPKIPYLTKAEIKEIYNG